jgi:hypothetical protein
MVGISVWAQKYLVLKLLNNIFLVIFLSGNLRSAHIYSCLQITLENAYYLLVLKRLLGSVV